MSAPFQLLDHVMVEYERGEMTYGEVGLLLREKARVNEKAEQLSIELTKHQVSLVCRVGREWFSALNQGQSARVCRENARKELVGSVLCRGRR